MTTSPISLDGEHLTIDAVVAIAREPCPVALADDARPRIDASRAWVDQLVARGSYGTEVARLWGVLRGGINDLARAYGIAPLGI